MGKLLRAAGPLEDETGLHLLVLDVLVLKKLGPKALLWDSEVLHSEIEHSFGPVGLVTWERIQAARLLHAKNSFWLDWEVFEKCTSAVVGRPAIFGASQPPEAEEIAVALATADRIDHTHEYSDEVKRYMTAACLNDGLWHLEGRMKELLGPLVQEYCEHHRVVVDHAAVEHVLGKSPRKGDPDDPAEVQAGRVLAVRDILDRHAKEVADQMARLPELLGAAK